jgi:hypothetical protein
MPANKYTRSLYKPGTVKAEKAAIANRDPARKKAAEKIMKREGTTSKAGGRAAAGAGAGLGAVAASEAAARAAKKIMKREGTTSPSGGRTQAVLRITKDTPPPKRIKLPANPNKPLVRQNAIIRTTTNMKPTPTAKKR